MALVRKELPGSAHGYQWENAGDVIAVHDDLAHQLLRIPGFTEVPPDDVSPGTDVPAASGERHRKVTRKGM